MRKRLGCIIALLMVAGVFACAGSNLVTALSRSRQKRTMADMRTIGTLLEARANDIKSYSMGPARPLAGGAMHRVAARDVQRALYPRYVKKPIVLIDGWGNPLYVYVGGYDTQGRAAHYLVRSLGADGRAEGSRYRVGMFSGENGDLVFSDGNFVRYHDGICMP